MKPKPIVRCCSNCQAWTEHEIDRSMPACDIEGNDIEVEAEVCIVCGVAQGQED